jgi:CelD/BcsL family acetyltransferase involved in cellulose biosynthesis
MSEAAPTLAAPVLAAPPDAAAWDALVAACPEATVFHTSAWASLWISEWPGAKWEALVLEDGDGYAAALPMVVRRRTVARAVYSMPFGTYGGPLVRAEHPDPGGARRRLLEAYAERVGGAWTLRSELTWFPGSTAEIPEGLHPYERSTHMLPLTADFGTLAAGFAPSTRRLVRQAMESGLELRPAESEEDVRAFYALAVETIRRRGGRVQPYSLYRRIHELLGPAGLARFHLVRRGETPVAGSLHLFHAGVATNWLPVSRESAWHLRPNNFLVAGLLESLCAAGYVAYDFGASPPGAAGLIRFKEGWGARPRPVAVAGRRSGLHRRLRG